jgi:hypothetical protein
VKAKTHRGLVGFANSLSTGVHHDGMKLPAHKVREVALEAMVDPRSVQRYLAGKTVRPSLIERIERALRTLNLTEPPNGGDRPTEKESA